MFTKDKTILNPTCANCRAYTCITYGVYIENQKQNIPFQFHQTHKAFVSILYFTWRFPYEKNTRIFVWLWILWKYAECFPYIYIHIYIEIIRMDGLQNMSLSSLSVLIQKEMFKIIWRYNKRRIVQKQPAEIFIFWEHLSI